MDLTVDQFISRVFASGLLTDEELRQISDRHGELNSGSDGRMLADSLVAAGTLTGFQASELFAGRTKRLVLGEYVMLDPIGSGGMGQVFKARHRRMDRLAAIKLLPDNALASDEAVRRFQQEVRVAAALSHPNIVLTYDASEQNGLHYLVMEYIDGQTLSALAKSHGSLPVEQAVGCGAQAAEGLTYAHEQGVIHRDIKPSNLIVNRHGVLKILDMGLARMADVLGPADRTTDERLTVSGQLMGTCDYMSPEQAENTQYADQRSDIYSLGCTLFHLLAGHPPYRGATAVATLLAHREAPVPELHQTRDDISKDLDLLVMRMMAKRPEDRPSTMRQVHSELTSCQLNAALAELEGETFTAAMSALGQSVAAMQREVDASKKHEVEQQPRPVIAELAGNDSQRVVQREEAGLADSRRVEGEIVYARDTPPVATQPTVAGNSSPTVVQSTATTAPTFFSGCLLGILTMMVAIPIAACGGCLFVARGCEVGPSQTSPKAVDTNVEDKPSESENSNKWTIEIKSNDDGDDPPAEDDSDPPVEESPPSPSGRGPG